MRGDAITREGEGEGGRTRTILTADLSRPVYRVEAR